MSERKKYARNPNTKCSVCLKLIYRRPKELQESQDRYCSRVCYGLSNRKEHPCVICGTSILASDHKKTCSRSCANKHRTGIRYKIGRPNDKVVSQQALKKRLSGKRGYVCERCNYNIFLILQVHHKDRNRDNNKLNNLELLCPNCHAEEHYLKNQ